MHTGAQATYPLPRPLSLDNCLGSDTVHCCGTKSPTMKDCYTCTGQPRIRISYTSLFPVIAEASIATTGMPCGPCTIPIRLTTTANSIADRGKASPMRLPKDYWPTTATCTASPIACFSSMEIRPKAKPILSRSRKLRLPTQSIFSLADAISTFSSDGTMDGKSRTGMSYTIGCR